MIFRRNAPTPGMHDRYPPLSDFDHEPARFFLQDTRLVYIINSTTSYTTTTTAGGMFSLNYRAVQSKQPIKFAVKVRVHHSLVPHVKVFMLTGTTARASCTISLIV